MNAICQENHVYWLGLRDATMTDIALQLPSCVWLFITPWTASWQASLALTISWSLPKFMSIESAMASNHLILCHPLLLLPSVFPSIRICPVIWLFASSGQIIRASASGSVLSMSIQGSFPLKLTGLFFLQSKGLSRVFLQHHSSKASLLQCLTFFMVQFSHTYMTTAKTIALTIQTFVSHKLDNKPFSFKHLPH